MCVWGGGGGTSLQNSCILAISDVRLQIVDFSLWFKKSDHVITFFWLCGFENTDHVALFLRSSHGREKKKT